MKALRAVVALAILTALVLLGISGREGTQALDPAFTFLGSPTMPFVPSGQFVTSSWFCPGVPSGEEGVGGRVVVTNPSDEPLDGRITVYTTAEDAPAVEQRLTIAARTSQSITLADLQPSGSFLSAVVEIDGGGGFVEQEAVHPAGHAVAACSNAASSTWYFADGFTVDDSVERLVITNPYPSSAIVDIGFVTKDGTPRNPGRLQGVPVPAHSVRVIDFGAKDEPILAAQVIASRGRVVVGRSQHFIGGGRLGYTMSLGAPSLSSQYYFADGEQGDGITEEYRIFNPTDEDVTVDAVFLGTGSTTTTGTDGTPTEGFVNDVSIDVPHGGYATLSTADVDGLPVGRHGTVFSTFAGDSIVVERVLTRPAGESVATTVVMGSPSVLASTRWSGGIGSSLAVDGVFVVLNVDLVDTTVSVSTLGPAGFVPVPGLDAVPLPAGSVISIDLPEEAVGRPFRVESGQRIFVERLLPRGEDLRGRSGSFPLAG